MTNYPIDDEISRIESDIKSGYRFYHENKRYQQMKDDIMLLLEEIKRTNKPMIVSTQKSFLQDED